MQIYVGKNGQQLGPFTLDEVNRKLAEGTFTGSDLGWYEGASGWAPLSGIPGVIIRAAAAAPISAPAPAPVQPAAAPAPVRPNAPIVQPPRSPTRTLSIVSWVFLGLSFLVSFIPVVGCGTWLILGVPTALLAIILGIIMLARGGTGAGIVSILGGVLIVPLCFAASALSTMVFGGTVERQQQKQILSNLRAIELAKGQWVADTKAANGAPVTMANLTKQLGGKSVTPTAVGETYDPMPVGQAPTATLPAKQTLGKFGPGEILTAANLEAALASGSIFDSFHRSSPSPSPSAAASVAPSVAPKPSEAPSVAPSPKPSVAPSVTPSPRPSVSPRSSSTPHSLISPRQSMEPGDSPSSRPSPSAKFAPRVNPRQSPAPNDNSGGLKQGRQYPRESPGQTPDSTPDDDDDDNN